MGARAARVLTVRQPHAYLLVHGSPNAGIKDVENRSRPTSYRGTLLIQASATVDKAAYDAYIAQGIELPPAEDLSPARSSALSRSPAVSAIRGRGGPYRVTGTG
jgi:hypothetical protein